MARILLAKLGLDGHDVGAKVLAAALRDAGHEVIYLGIRQTATGLARVAVDEDVDLVAVSILSGAHRQLLPKLVNALRELGSPAPIVVGGLIPEADRPALLTAGVVGIAEQGVSLRSAVAGIDEVLQRT